MVIEKVCDEGEVEFWVAGDEGGWGEKFTAGELVCVLEDLFGTLEEVAGLEGGAGAEVGGKLGEEDGVIVAVFDVRREI